MFLDLFLHIQEQIMEYCSFDDLKTLSLLDSHHRRALEVYIKHAARIPKSHFSNMTSTNALQIHQTIRNFNTCKVMRMHTHLHHIPRSTFEAVSTLQHLHKLNISRCRKADDMGISILCAGLKQLKVFILSYSKITVKGCVHIAKLSALERLVMRRCSGICDDAMLHLSTMTSLRKLDVAYCMKITQIGFQKAYKFSQLDSLIVRGCKLNESAFSNIARVRSLRKLDASYSELSDFGVACLTGLKYLEELNVRSCTLLTNECIAPLKKMESLKVLHIHDCNITDDQDELLHLPYVNRLKFLPSHLRTSGIIQ